MKVTIMLLLVLFIVVSCSATSRSYLPSFKTLEVEEHMRRINKPAVKSIQSSDGDIIDCIDIYSQPAFDHPDFQNHTIQMRPSYHPEGRLNETKKEIRQMWHSNGRCPNGTVAIRRTKKEDVMRAISVSAFGKKDNSSISHLREIKLKDFWSGHEHSFARARDGPYYGTKAILNLWNPYVQQQNEFSLSQLWIISGGPIINTIEAGWTVNPFLYGDFKTRLFVFWTSDTYQNTGCYNLLCSGFVQVSSDVAVGTIWYPTSEYGSQQYDLTLLVWMDPSTGHWWLEVNGETVGYWPSFIFTDLASASRVEWGGEIVNQQTNGRHTTTQMGNGHFPFDGFKKASYIRNIQVIDATNTLKMADHLIQISEKPKCYQMEIGVNTEDSSVNSYVLFGGPGRSENCP